jgi:hypothetical protein
MEERYRPSQELFDPEDEPLIIEEKPEEMIKDVTDSELVKQRVLFDLWQTQKISMDCIGAIKEKNKDIIKTCKNLLKNEGFVKGINETLQTAFLSIDEVIVKRRDFVTQKFNEFKSEYNFEEFPKCEIAKCGNSIMYSVEDVGICQCSTDLFKIHRMSKDCLRAIDDYDYLDIQKCNSILEDKIQIMEIMESLQTAYISFDEIVARKRDSVTKKFDEFRMKYTFEEFPECKFAQCGENALYNVEDVGICKCPLT